MLSHPVHYQRDFSLDLPKANAQQPSPFWETSKKVALVALPLLSCYGPLHTPISLVMGSVRCIANIRQGLDASGKGELVERNHSFIQATLSSLSVGLAFFNTGNSLIISTFGDLLIHFRQCKDYLQEGNNREGLRAIALMVLDCLYISSIGYGGIELTVASMLLQACIGMYQSASHLHKSQIWEGIGHMLTTALQLKGSMPQIALLKWKWQNNPIAMAELQQDAKGFTYLKIPDDYVKSLFPLCSDPKAVLPPYFSAGKVGAHISVMTPAEALSVNSSLQQHLGKKFKFTIANTSSVKPFQWKGVDKVWFLSLVSADLENMRKMVGLSHKLHGHDFHLTYGIKYSQTA